MLLFDATDLKACSRSRRSDSTSDFRGLSSPGISERSSSEPASLSRTGFSIDIRRKWTERCSILPSVSSSHAHAISSFVFFRVPLLGDFFRGLETRLRVSAAARSRSSAYMSTPASKRAYINQRSHLLVETSGGVDSRSLQRTGHLDRKFSRWQQAQLRHDSRYLVRQRHAAPPSNGFACS